MNTTLVVLALWIVTAGVPAGSQSNTSTEVGYVVEASAGTEWEAAGRSKTPRPVKPGDGIFAGDTLSLRQGSKPAGAFLGVLLFATGRLIKVEPGQTIDAQLPEKPGVLQRLRQAIRRRLNNEQLVPGLVRSGSIVRDTVVAGSAPIEWSRLTPDLAAGPYTARFRRLDAEGNPVGDWTASKRFEVSASGVTPRESGLPAERGLWQMSVRHQRVPSLSGNAWILVTRDPEDVVAFDQLNRSLGESLKSEGIELDPAATRMRRAAMLVMAAK